MQSAEQRGRLTGSGDPNRLQGEGSFAERRAEGKAQPGPLRGGPVLPLCSARGRQAPGFPLVGAWEGPRRGRAGSAWCARRLGRAGRAQASGPSPQVLEMFTLVLRQCHKESEDRWKRLSRQVADVILPMLAKQQVRPPPRPHLRLPWGQPWSCVLRLTPSGRVSSALTVHRGQCGARVRDGLAPTRLGAASFPAHPASLLFALSGRVFSCCLQSSLAVSRHLGSLVERCHRWAPSGQG